MDVVSDQPYSVPSLLQFKLYPSLTDGRHWSYLNTNSSTFPIFCNTNFINKCKHEFKNENRNEGLHVVEDEKTHPCRSMIITTHTDCSMAVMKWKPKQKRRNKEDEVERKRKRMWMEKWNIFYPKNDSLFFSSQ